MNGTLKRLFPKVVRVCDAKSSIQIEVTKGDARESGRKKHSECAMAIACKRSLGVTGVLIGRSVSYLIKDETATRFSTPSTVSREITSYDRGSSFEPGRYLLSKHNRKLEKETGGHKKKTGRGKSVHYHHITENIREMLGAE